jgi:hypothetical protein
MAECRWLKPVLVGRFEFVEWRPDSHLRQSRFVALQDDKRALEVPGSLDKTERWLGRFRPGKIIRVHLSQSHLTTTSVNSGLMDLLPKGSPRPKCVSGSLQLGRAGSFLQSRYN